MSSKFVVQIDSELCLCDCDDRNVLDFRSSDFVCDAKHMSDVTLKLSIISLYDLG